MLKDPGYRLLQKGQLKRVGNGQAQWVDEVVTGDAPQAREHFSGEIQIRLAEDRLFDVIGVAREDTEAVFQNKLEGRTRGFRDV